MCIVWRTDPSERAVVAVLVEIDLLPASIRIGAERVLDGYRLQRPGLRSAGEQDAAAGCARFKESTSCDVHDLVPAIKVRRCCSVTDTCLRSCLQHRGGHFDIAQVECLAWLDR